MCCLLIGIKCHNVVYNNEQTSFYEVGEGLKWEKYFFVVFFFFIVAISIPQLNGIICLKKVYNYTTTVSCKHHSAVFVRKFM